MTVLMIGKRFYTNRDAVAERFGRIYKFPYTWSKCGINTKLWLVDYHTKNIVGKRDSDLWVSSTPIFSLSMLRTIFAFMRERNITHIVASGDCYIGLLAYLLARIKGAQYIFDIYDKYDEFKGYRHIPFFSPMHFLLKYSDQRIFASKHLASHYQKTIKNYLISGNGIDRELFSEKQSEWIRSRFIIDKSQTIIGYFGSMEHDRGIDDLVEASALAAEVGISVIIVLAGASAENRYLEHKNVIYLGNVEHSMMPELMAACDILALPYRESPFLNMASSCKIAEYLSMRRPILATRTPNLTENFPEQAQELREYLAEPGNPRSLAKSIEKLVFDPIIPSTPKNISWGEIAKDLANKLKLQ